LVFSSTQVAPQQIPGSGLAEVPSSQMTPSPFLVQVSPTQMPP
jgi:hypothetical protein